jgi:hypothetical protein
MPSVVTFRVYPNPPKGTRVLIIVFYPLDYL